MAIKKLINISPVAKVNHTNIVKDNKILTTINDSNNNNTQKIDVENFNREHIVESVETLSQIAKKYNLTYQELIDYNNITDPNNINVGQVIKIPNSPPPKVHDRKTNIDTTNVLPNSKIAKAIKENQKEINESFRVKINEKDFITMKDVTVENRPCILTYIIIENPSQIKGEPANGKYATGVEKTSDAAKRKQATLMINGSNFIEGIGTQDLRKTNHIAIVNGKIMQEGISEGMEICLDKNGRLFTPNSGTTASELIEQGVTYSFASLDSRLIWNGEKDYISQPNIEEDNEYNSTIIAMKEPGEYYILTGETTNRGARDYLYDIGCTYAKSMDQGGSVTLVLDGEIINNPTDEEGERSVADFLYFT